MAYPSTLTGVITPNASDKLSTSPHTAIEIAQNTGVTEIQTFVGTLASTAGTLIYDVRSPSSNGGGHVQTAVLGGTGQITYTKGDLLTAQSASVLSKLSVGLDGQILSANSSVATGVTWIDNAKPKISTSASVITVTAPAETSIFSISIPGSTLGTNNAIRGTVYISSWNPRSSTLVRAMYGGGTVASVLFTSPGTDVEVSGKIEYTLIANNSANVQRALLEVNLGTQQFAVGFPSGGPISSTLHGFDSKASSIASAANQVFGLTIRESTTTNGLIVDGNIIQKIV